MRFISTRGQSAPVSAAEAIVRGLAPDGGLYVPEEIPRLPQGFLEKIAPMTYPQRAAEVLKLYLPEFDGLDGMCERAYSRFDDRTGPAPLVFYANSLPYVLELYHGPTCAFKDMALQLLPHLLTKSLEMTGEDREICILTATSGDTGKAALEGFRDIEGTRVLVFYPQEGVSSIQKLQMTTQEGGNVGVCGIHGNFDDAQTAVKRVFSDKEFAKNLPGVALSSANSINLGRLLPQIAYYISAVADLMSAKGINLQEKPVDVCVPTGNFGNILAAWYAKQMGAPIGKLLCASNKNDVLTELMHDGVYASDREFYTTISPSMDILVSSNWERALFELSGHDWQYTAECMESLRAKGKYEVRSDIAEAIKRRFDAATCDDDRTRAVIAEVFERSGKIIDPHTAVAFDMAMRYMETSERPCIAVSTAHPAKFPEAVGQALEGKAVIDEPTPLRGILERPVRFGKTVSKDRVSEVVKEFAITGKV